MNEQQTMIIDNVNHVSTHEGMVRFCDKEAQLIAAFHLKNIVGFMRMNEPNIEMPEYKWDFGTVAEPPN